MKAAHTHARDASPRAGTPPVRGASWRAELGYNTDEIRSRGTLGIILSLAAMTLTVVVIAATVLAIFRLQFNDGVEEGFFESAWQSLLRAIDPGTMGSDTGWGPRLVALLVTLAG